MNLVSMLGAFQHATPFGLRLSAFQLLSLLVGECAVLRMSRCQGVRIWHPLDVTAMVCSYWAETQGNGCSNTSR
jgi:hypothetical protein